MIKEYMVRNKNSMDNNEPELNYEVKLIDFGFSLQNSGNNKLTMLCGTPCYMAPEIIGCKEYDGKPTDVWSLGIVQL